MKSILPVLFIGAFLTLCACSSSNKSDQQQTAPEEKATLEPSLEFTSSTKSNENQVESTSLVGIWQSIDDPTNFMEFTETELIWLSGTPDTVREPYQLANKCLNASNEFAIELNESKYLSLAKSDLCWFIVNLDENNIEMAYVGRGNTLKYKKVGSIDVTEVDDDPRVVGVLKSIDDTGIYGLWSMRVEVNSEERYFNYDSETPPSQDLIGTHIEITYKVETVKREVDVIYQDTDGQASIHGEYSQFASNDWQTDSTWEKVEGYLIAEELAGDTPVAYYVETDEGEMIEFEEFVNENYQRINGQAVVVYYRIDQNITATSVIKALVGDSYDPQVVAINREVGQIDEKVVANRFQDVMYEMEEGGGFVKYQRSSENNSLKFITVAYCTGHGCERTSYYFSQDKLLLILEENSQWVGNTDKIREKRRYFDRQQEIFCAERAAEGEGGYDVVRRKMETFQLTEVKCGESFDMAGIETLKDLTEETAASYFQQ